MKEALNEELTPAFFPHREDSPTAASAHKPLYGPSGVMTYRVFVAGIGPVDVEAATGDDAAAAALVKYPGAKVGHVAPAPKAD